MKNCDLHTHSHHSIDCTISPTDLVKEAKKLKIKYLALTDHDSIDGLKEAVKAGKKYGVEVICGVELHSDLGEVLGYFIDPDNKIIKTLCRKNKQLVNERAKKMIVLLRKKGYVIDFDEIKRRYKKDIVERPLIAFELVRKKCVKSFRDAFDKLIANNKPCFVEAAYLPTLKVVKLIRKSGGLPVLAHPYALNCGSDYKKQFKIMEKLVKAGLVGMEEYSSPYRHECYGDFIKKAKIIVKKYRLIFTSGSDYHGKTHPDNKLGEFNCDETVVLRMREMVKK